MAGRRGTGLRPACSPAQHPLALQSLAGLPLSGGPTRHLPPHYFPSQHLPHWAAVANHPGSVQPDHACPPLARRGQLTLGAGQVSDAAGAATGSCWAQPHPGSCSCKHLVPQANACPSSLPETTLCQDSRQWPHPLCPHPATGCLPCYGGAPLLAAPLKLRPASYQLACSPRALSTEQVLSRVTLAWVSTGHAPSHHIPAPMAPWPGILFWDLLHLHTALETQLRPPAQSALASPTWGPLAPWATPGWHCPVIGWSFCPC